MTMLQKREMKESGVDWIGKVPASWKIVPQWSRLRITKKLVGDDWDTTQLLSLTKQGVITRDIDSGEGKYPESFEGYQFVEPGDLIFCLFDIDETPRTIGMSRVHGMITSAYTRMRVIGDTDPNFLEWYFLDVDNYKKLRPFYTGLRKVVTRERFLAMRMALPPLEEQVAIAEFLDRETAQIDELIAKQEQLIETLKERRNTYLIKMFSMPATGTETGWSFIPLKHLVTAVAGGTPESDNEEYWADQGLPWISIGDMSQVKLVTETKRRVTKAGIESKKLFIGQPGTVLFAMYASVGETSILGVEATWNQAILGMVPISGRTSSSFLQRTLEAHKHLWNLYANSNTQFNLNRESTLALKLPIPDMAEQLRIVNAMDEYESAIDPLIQRANKMVEILSERRQALISAAVTGKIDVRGK